MSKSNSNSDDVQDSHQSNEIANSGDEPNNFYIGSHSKMLSSRDDQNNGLVLAKHQSFSHLDKSKVQLTWKNVTITAPPKKRRCKRVVEGEERVILGN